MKHNFASAVLLIILCGCAVPTKVNLQGPVFSPESLAFLNMKGTSRDEVITTLGQPALESTNLRVLIYLDETATHWNGVTLEPTLFPNNSDKPLGFKPVRVNENDNHQLRALFIAYDEHGMVKSHAVQRIGNPNHSSLEDLCARYANRNANLDH